MTTTTPDHRERSTTHRLRRHAATCGTLAMALVARRCLMTRTFMRPLLLSACLALGAAAIAAPAAEARVCTPGVPGAHDLRANKHVSCAKARKVARRSFKKITLCIKRGTCRAAGFRCRTRMAKNAPPGLSGGFMICRRGKGRIRYGFGG